ncbi:hypothetical protein ACBQ28_19315 [Pseudomonas lundensis]|uniref:hypothetical protein n=1 Tax=Pseudomonas lundensis TaxID=86185 RepID=UPI003523F789
MPPPLAMGNVRLSCGLTETIKLQYLQVKKNAMRGFPLPFKGLPRGDGRRFTVSPKDLARH